jgi:membrane protein implicated in regulation of membrane protease activity
LGRDDVAKIPAVSDTRVDYHLRRAYEADRKSGSQALVGARSVAQERLDPRGYVRVRGELWNAVANPIDRVIFAGTEVEIVGADGMEVVVTARGKDRKK